MKNIVGLWLVQECRRIWKLAGKTYSWDDLSRHGRRVRRHWRRWSIPDDAVADGPADMPEAIRELCQRSGPDGAAGRRSRDPHGDRKPGATLSAGFACRLEELTGGRVETIHVVGGGTQNRQLCQATADACRRRVVAGPVEATAIGNVMVQAVAAGAVGSIARRGKSFARASRSKRTSRAKAAAWGDAAGRFDALMRVTMPSPAGGHSLL